MNLPRLIIADDIEEQRAVPPSVLLVQAMKSCGMRLNVFMSSRREEDLRLMELLSGDAVTCIDAYTAGSGKSLKTLFQRRSTPDAISVVCVPLGKRIGVSGLSGTLGAREGPELRDPPGPSCLGRRCRHYRASSVRDLFDLRDR